MSMMKVLLLVASLALLLAGCSGGEVSAEAVPDYQKAGLPPGEKPIVATPGAEEAGER